MPKKFFSVHSGKYVSGTDYEIVRPASLNVPKDHAVMFITESYLEKKTVFDRVNGCLIFWPERWEIPAWAAEQNAFCPCKNPRVAYCRFFSENQITGLPVPDEIEMVRGAWIAKTARIGRGTTVFPGAYIGGEVMIGEDCYIGAGVTIIGRVLIGDRVCIRENTVLGADGLSTDRDETGRPTTMPQFGGIVIENDVKIGANSVIARGAIDDTVLHQGCKIDNLTFVSHNVSVGEESFVVGSTLLFGSASVGRQAQVSGGCVVGNYVHIGERSLLGMGSVANKSIPENVIAYGNPARPVRKRFEETDS